MPDRPADRPIIFSAPMMLAMLNGKKTQTRRLAWHALCTEAPPRRTVWQSIQSGDRLWVREAFALADNGHEEWPVYRADGAALPELHPARKPATWRSSIRMPRWASRLTLVVTGVRRQRLQDITDPDAIAEGVSVLTPGSQLPPRMVFAGLWDRLHGTGAWATNPEVVAIAFTVHRRNIDHAR